MIGHPAFDSNLKIALEQSSETRETHHTAGAPATWPYRLWRDQARRLYLRPEAQRLALQHHLTILRRHAPTGERLLWLDDLGRDLAGEVAR